MPAVAVQVDEVHQVTKGEHAHIAQALGGGTGEPGFEPVAGVKSSNVAPNGFSRIPCKSTLLRT
jgi:hypothetical protein